MNLLLELKKCKLLDSFIDIKMKLVSWAPLTNIGNLLHNLANHTHILFAKFIFVSFIPSTPYVKLFIIWGPFLITFVSLNWTSTHFFLFESTVQYYQMGSQFSFIFGFFQPITVVIIIFSCKLHSFFIFYTFREYNLNANLFVCVIISHQPFTVALPYPTLTWFMFCSFWNPCCWFWFSLQEKSFIFYVYTHQ